MAELKLSRRINKDIKVGDTVRLTDGSGLTFDGDKKLIIYSDPEITGSELKLLDLDFKVVETNVKDSIAASVCNTFYLQDIAIEINGKIFRTCSSFVKKVESTYEMGDRFIVNGGECILAAVGILQFCLISLRDGNRWTEPVKAKSHIITQEELNQMGMSGEVPTKIEKNEK